jgi:hypothetical protein
MMPQTLRSRAAGRVHVGVPGRPHYGMARRGALHAVHATRLTAMGRTPRAWWQRVADDREFVGAKLLLLAALIVLTAVLEGAV